MDGNLVDSAARFRSDAMPAAVSRCAKNAFDPADHETAQRTRLSVDTLFQILQLEDTTVSEIQELETLKELESDQNVSTDKLNKNVNRKSLRVITRVDTESDDMTGGVGDEPSGYDKSVFKLLLQDSFGNLSYAVELEKLGFLKLRPDQVLPVPLGSKLIVKRGTVILRGCFLLGNANCEFLGGEMRQLNHDYVRRRISQLTKSIEESRAAAQ